MCRMRTEGSEISTPITSNWYEYEDTPNLSIQTCADRISSRRLRGCTASTGDPNPTPRRALTSTKAIRSPCRTIKSMSRCPLRNRWATICHPSRRSQRAAIRSPSKPSSCRAWVMTYGTIEASRDRHRKRARRAFPTRAANRTFPTVLLAILLHTPYAPIPARHRVRARRSCFDFVRGCTPRWPAAGIGAPA